MKVTYVGVAYFCWSPYYPCSAAGCFDWEKTLAPFISALLALHDCFLVTWPLVDLNHHAPTYKGKDADRTSTGPGRGPYLPLPGEISLAVWARWRREGQVSFYKQPLSCVDSK